MEKKRRTELDIAKGIGIILVVLAHAAVPYSRYINGFHMPFFFFISGMLFVSKDNSFIAYTKKKVKGLLVRFWIWNLALYPVFYILYYWKQWSVKVLVVDLLEIGATVDKVPFLGATWFLASLFWTAVLFKALYLRIQKFACSRQILFVTAMAVAILGYCVTFPYRISRTLICASFYILGYLYNESGIEKINRTAKCICTVVLGAGYIIITYFCKSSLPGNRYDNFVLFYVGAICAIYSLIQICTFISKSRCKVCAKHLAFLGKNSMGIVIWQFLAFRFAVIIQIIVLGGSLRWLVDFPVHEEGGLWWIVYTITGIYISVLTDFILKKISSKIKSFEKKS